MCVLRIHVKCAIERSHDLALTLSMAIPATTISIELILLLFFHRILSHSRSCSFIHSHVNDHSSQKYSSRKFYDVTFHHSYTIRLKC